MLSQLVIHNIVLIDKLVIDLPAGLTVLSGETGAGKSILLDSLGLALGARAQPSLIRAGADDAQVVAVFEPAQDHPVFEHLIEHGVDASNPLIFKRKLSRDGRGRAFLNDDPISVSLLRSAGRYLVEVHGQHDDRALLDARGHGALLDLYAGNQADLGAVANNYEALTQKRKSLEDAREEQLRAARELDYWRHAAAELHELSPLPGEEQELADQRIQLKTAAAIGEEMGQLNALLTDDDGAEGQLRSAIRRLSRLDDGSLPALKALIEKFMAAAEICSEANSQLARLSWKIPSDTSGLDSVEERLFALRAAARKYRVTVDDLPQLAEDFASRVARADEGAEGLEALKKDVEAAEQAFKKAAERLSKTREKASIRLEKAVMVELPALKLDAARFAVSLTTLPEEQWGQRGGERVEFMISTNPGAPFAPLTKIASGGELARFILSLKVVLAATGEAPTLIFDEVDRGIGGATASAVGERLARLADVAQTLVITHSPQVAARGNHHLQISKSLPKTGTKKGTTVTTVTPLEDFNAKRDEIARMLSADTLTAEARAAAESLLAVSAIEAGDARRKETG
ncbi:MAG: DNA repair protein RecN [Pseudomonadota bacterium]